MDPANESSSKTWQLIAAELSSLGFEISGCQSETAQSIVLKGRQTLLQREVAIKILASLDRSDANYERFQKEVKLLATFDHPNIVKLYGSGRLQDGRPYMVMEFVHGVTLARMLESNNGALPERSIIAYAAQICSALSYAHEKNIVHRDLKPANIMLLSGESRDNIKLVDFGIHKNIDAANQNITAAGNVAPGTVNYMSPEQCRGGAVDTRSDIYSVGCVLFELCTGKPPMDAETDWLIMSNHLNKKVKELSFGKMSARMKMLIARCLEKDPAARWHSADEMRNQLAAGGFSDINSNRAYTSGIVVLLLLLFSAGFFFYSQSRPAAKNSEPDDNLELQSPWTSFVARKKSQPKEWTSKCRRWLKLHLNDSNFDGLLVCLGEPAITDWKETPTLIIGLRDRVEAFYRKHGPEGINAIDILQLKFRTECLTNSWPQAKETMKVMLARPDCDEGFKVSLLTAVISSYQRAGLHEPVIETVDKYLSICHDHEPRAKLLTQAAASSITDGLLTKRTPAFLQAAVEEYLDCRAISDLNAVLTTCALLQQTHLYDEQLKMYKHLLPTAPINRQTEGMYWNMAQALFQLKRQDEAEVLLAKMAASDIDTIISFVVQDLQLTIAVERKQKELIEQRAKVVMQQFEYAGTEKGVYPQYTGLVNAWIKYPELEKTCVKELSEMKNVRWMDLGVLFTSYAHNLRCENRTQDAVHFYLLAQSAFDRSDKAFPGRYNTYVGEALSYLYLNEADKAKECIEQGKKFLKSIPPDFTAENGMEAIDGTYYRSTGNYGLALKTHTHVMEDLKKRKNEFPLEFSCAVLEVAMDYRYLKNIKAELEFLNTNMPLIHRGVAEIDVIVARLEQERGEITALAKQQSSI